MYGHVAPDYRIYEGTTFAESAELRSGQGRA